MLDSLFFAGLRFSQQRVYSLTTPAIVRYCVGAIPTLAEKKWVKWLCEENPSSKPMSVTDACEPINRSSARSTPHGICIKRRRYAGVFPKKLEEMRTRQACITRHRSRVRYLGRGHRQAAGAICGRGNRRLAEAARQRRAGGPTPRFVEAGVEKLVQIPMDDPITRGCHERVGEARANRAERRSDPDPVAAEAQAAAALLVAIEPAVTDIRHQEDSRLLFEQG